MTIIKFCGIIGSIYGLSCVMNTSLIALTTSCLFYKRTRDSLLSYIYTLNSVIDSVIPMPYLPGEKRMMDMINTNCVELCTRAIIWSSRKMFQTSELGPQKTMKGPQKKMKGPHKTMNSLKARHTAQTKFNTDMLDDVTRMVDEMENKNS